MISSECLSYDCQFLVNQILICAPCIYIECKFLVGLLSRLREVLQLLVVIL
jgi:hypothetical protein